MPTAALAARNNAAARSARGRACLPRLLARALPEQSIGRFHYGPAPVSSLPNLLPGADGSFGLRLATNNAPLQKPATVKSGSRWSWIFRALRSLGGS